MIESVDNSRIKDIRKLKEKKYRDQYKLFLVGRTFSFRSL